MSAPTAEDIFGPNPWITNAGEVKPDGTIGLYQPWYFATPATAAKVAQLIGGKVIPSYTVTGEGGPSYNQNQPSLMVELPNGLQINAGLVASAWTHGYPQVYVDRDIASMIGVPDWTMPTPPVVAAPPAPPPYVPPGVLGQAVSAQAPEVDGMEVGFVATRTDGSQWQKGWKYTMFGATLVWTCVKAAN